MNILGLDFETTGTDIKNDHITEVGAALVSVDNGNYTYLERLQMFCWEVGYPKLTPEIIELTGITDDMLQTDGASPKTILEAWLFPLMEKATYILAHNKNFDQGILEAVSARYGLTPPKKPWLCTIADVPYASKYRCKKLSHLALDHGIMLDSRALHRALDDVELMLELVTTKYDFEKVLEYYKTPWVYVRAVIPGPWEDKGVGKTQAQNLGYGWERARGTDTPVFPKLWVKRVKASEVDKETAQAPFKVVRLIEGE